MKIITTQHVNKPLTFDDLKPGDIFTFPAFIGGTYMKMVYASQFNTARLDDPYFTNAVPTQPVLLFPNATLLREGVEEK